MSDTFTECDYIAVFAYVKAKDAEIAALREALRWRSMDSAPKNGTEILLRVKYRAGIPGKCLVGHWMRGGHCIEDHPPIEPGWYFWTGCAFDAASEPIAWMPLPDLAEAERVLAEGQK